MNANEALLALDLSDTVTLPRELVTDLAEYMESWAEPNNKNNDPQNAQFIAGLRTAFASRLRAKLEANDG